MKKIVLYYCLIIYLFVFTVTLITIFQNIRVEYIVLCLNSLSGCFAIYFLSNEKHITFSLYFLIVTHLLQSFRIIYNGVGYDFVEGFNVYGNINNEEGDVISKFSIMPCSFEFQLGGSYDPEIFLFGINFIHLGLFIYFLRMLGRYETVWKS